MLLIPAIDLKEGQCVRLKQGDMERATVFSEDPGAMALHWISCGARRLHIVDLNGAFAGVPKNKDAIRSIVQAAANRIPIQIGGGIRDLQTIEAYLNAGMSYVILGTAAVNNPEFFAAACRTFSGHIILGVDAKEGRVATAGWSHVTEHDAIDLIRQLENDGCAAVIYTDISRDGMLQGLNLEMTGQLALATKLPVIASGGLAGLADIQGLCTLQKALNQAQEMQAVEAVHSNHALNTHRPHLQGVICGQAIYSGALDLSAAQHYADTF